MPTRNWLLDPACAVHAPLHKDAADLVRSIGLTVIYDETPLPTQTIDVAMECATTGCQRLAAVMTSTIVLK